MPRPTQQDQITKNRKRIEELEEQVLELSDNYQQLATALAELEHQKLSHQTTYQSRLDLLRSLRQSANERRREGKRKQVTKSFYLDAEAAKAIDELTDKFGLRTASSFITELVFLFKDYL